MAFAGNLQRLMGVEAFAQSVLRFIQIQDTILYSAAQTNDIQFKYAHNSVRLYAGLVETANKYDLSYYECSRSSSSCRQHVCSQPGANLGTTL